MIKSKDRTSAARRLLPLWKVIGHLRGLAILTVVVNHAAFFGVMQYRFSHGQVTSCRAPFGIPWESVMPGWVALQELTRFCVPLFLVLAGHYVAGFSRTWTTIWSQARKLLFPFLFWSLLAWGYTAWFHPPGWKSGEFLARLLLGETQAGYYFIPLILQYYVLAHWAVPWVKRKPVSALSISAILQLSWIGFNYFAVSVRGGVIDFPWMLDPLPECGFPRFFFFFIFGIWIGNYPGRLKSLIDGRGPVLFVLALMSAVLLLGEHGVIFHTIRKPGAEIELWKAFLAMAQWKVTTSLWSLAVILLLFRLGQLDLLSGKWMWRLGGWAYVIYILNWPCLQPVVDLLGSWTIDPGLHGLVFLVLCALGVFLPLLILSVVRRWLPWARGVLGYS